MLQPGDVAPPFEARTHEEKTIRLSDYAGRRVLLWWYPAASTSG